MSQSPTTVVLMNKSNVEPNGSTVIDNDCHDKKINQEKTPKSSSSSTHASTKSSERPHGQFKSASQSLTACTDFEKQVMESEWEDHLECRKLSENDMLDGTNDATTRVLNFDEDRAECVDEPDCDDLFEEQTKDSHASLPTSHPHQHSVDFFGFNSCLHNKFVDDIVVGCFKEMVLLGTELSSSMNEMKVVLCRCHQLVHGRNRWDPPN